MDDRDRLYKDTLLSINRVKLRRAFDRFRLICLAKQVQLKTVDGDAALKKILGFLRGESSTEKAEVEKIYAERVSELRFNNKDLCERLRQLDLKNTLLLD